MLQEEELEESLKYHNPKKHKEEDKAAVLLML